MKKTENWLKEHINAGGTIINRGEEVDFILEDQVETFTRDLLSPVIRRYVERFRVTKVTNKA